MLAAGVDRIDRLLLPFGPVRIGRHDLRVPEDGIHRRADLMRHVRQKLRLVLVGLLDLLIGDDEITVLILQHLEIDKARVSEFDNTSEGIDQIGLFLGETATAGRAQGQCTVRKRRVDDKPCRRFVPAHDRLAPAEDRHELRRRLRQFLLALSRPPRRRYIVLTAHTRVLLDDIHGAQVEMHIHRFQFTQHVGQHLAQIVSRAHGGDLDTHRLQGAVEAQLPVGLTQSAVAADDARSLQPDKYNCDEHETQKPALSHTGVATVKRATAGVGSALKSGSRARTSNTWSPLSREKNTCSVDLVYVDQSPPSRRQVKRRSSGAVPCQGSMPCQLTTVLPDSATSSRDRVISASGGLVAPR